MNFEIERGNFFEELDPRMKLLLVIIITTMTFMAKSTYILLLNYSVIILLFVLCRLYSGAIKVSIFIITLVFLYEGIPFYTEITWHEGISLILFLMLRATVFIIMGSWMTSKLRIGDFITSMEKMELPKGMIVTIAVVFRYLPTVKREFYFIHSTMKLRGVGMSLENILLHPIRTIEYAIVPLILRNLTVADELSASVMTRGLDLGIKRIPYNDVTLKFIEILFVVLVILILVIGKVLLVTNI